MAKIHSTALPQSDSLDQALTLFLDEVSDWMEECMGKYATAAPTDGHDQANYMIGWEPLLRVREGAGGLRFMQQVRDQVRDHFVASGAWHHGYWRRQEVHHGTEHFLQFLYTLWGLDSKDEATVTQFLDAAEHFGNWSKEVEPWFDWGNRVYRSIYFGTDGVEERPDSALNMPDHLRCAWIALIAHAMTHNPRYLNLAEKILGRWADAITATPDLPIGLLAEGPVFKLATEQELAYCGIVSQVGRLESNLDRAENLLASGAARALLMGWERTKSTTMLAAVERILDELVGQIRDPDAGAAVQAMSTYRTATGSDRYDQAVLDAVEALDPYDIPSLQLDAGKKVLTERPSGIGKRIDMPGWLEGGQPRRHGPILIGLAAEIAEDDELARVAIDLSRAYLALAREAFPDGRDHACAARSVHAIAAGHGRDDGAGVCTAVLGPLLDMHLGHD